MLPCAQHHVGAMPQTAVIPPVKPAMKTGAMRQKAPGTPLVAEEVALAPPGPHDVLLRVRACGVCRTDLHLADGELARARYPVTPGHEIVGDVLETGCEVEEFRPGDRIGVPWLGGTCGACAFCGSGRENLCDAAVFTGATRDGGFASHVIADARYCLAIPSPYGDAEAAPLLCAGLIGYRAYRLAGDGPRVGLYGFGAAAHLLAQLAAAEGRKVFAFTRPGDAAAQAFALTLGAAWAGGSDTPPPEPLDAAILFAPVGALVPAALRAVRKGSRVVCAGIHMSDIPAFPYSILWGERSLCSVANLTREDGREFMRVAAQLPLSPSVQTFPLAEANAALARLRAGTLQGAAVLVPQSRLP
jgi:propanol-preferring alcohol dehydrogenase